MSYERNKKQQTYITKQILSAKLKRQMHPHKRQIFKEIKASIQDQKYRIFCQPISLDNKRPKTHNSLYRVDNLAYNSITKPNSMHRVSLYERPKQVSNYVKQVIYKIDEIQKLSSHFQSAIQQKKNEQKRGKKQRNNSPLGKKIQWIKKFLQDKQNEQIQNSALLRRKFQKKKTNSPNIYLGNQGEGLKKVISIAGAKDLNVSMLSRCITGGMINEFDQFSEVVSKKKLNKIQKEFITYDTVYKQVKLDKYSGIKDINPSKIDKLSFPNLIFYFQNEKTLKSSDKLKIQQKMKLIS